MEINEKSLLKLTSTLIIDYHQWRHRIGLNDNEVSIADIRNYCREWIKENLKDDADGN